MWKPNSYENIKWSVNSLIVALQVVADVLHDNFFYVEYEPSDLMSDYSFLYYPLY